MRTTLLVFPKKSCTVLKSCYIIWLVLEENKGNQGSRPTAHSINRHDYTPIRVIVPFKDQVSANAVKKRLTDLSSKLKTTIQPVFISRKLNEDLKVQEVKPAAVNQQCVVYKFQCNLCDTWFVGYTSGHFHERVDGHKQKPLSICKHYCSEHNSSLPPCISEQCQMLTKMF